MSQNQLTIKGKSPEEALIISAINQIISGNISNTATVTLTESSATTTVKNTRINANTFIDFMPTTANAATELASGSMYVSSRTKGEFTITHANNAQTDRTFVYTHVG